MKNDDDLLPISTPTSSTTTIFHRKDNPSSSEHSAGIFGRGRYKFYALSAILLLAFWSMLTGTVTLRWSAGNLNGFSDDYYNSAAAADDLDVLDMEEREKLVSHMWDVYVNSPKIRLAEFWQDAFVAAYEDMTSELVEVREEAVSEIARMSTRYVKLPPRSSSVSLNLQDLNLEHADHTISLSSMKRS